MKTNTFPKNGWKPRLRAGIYCSPSCGGNCTRAAFDTATQNAKALAAKMGNGWKARVWENLGWHYSVISPCGRLKLHADKMSYTAFLGEPDSGGGKWANTAKTPKGAVKRVVASAKADLAKIGACIEGL